MSQTADVGGQQSEGNREKALAYSQEVSQTARELLQRVRPFLPGNQAVCLFRSPTHQKQHASFELRAATGFTKPELARQFADEVRASAVAYADEWIKNTDELSNQDLAINDDDVSYHIWPLSFAGELRALLISNSEKPLTQEAQRALVECCRLYAQRFDHMVTRIRLHVAETRLHANEVKTRRGNHELLRLSEELFAQDVQLREINQKVDRVEELKEEFVVTLSRELQIPISNILASILEVLASDALGNGSEERSLLRQALGESDTLLRTLQNISTYWQIKHGETDLVISEVDIRELVDDLLHQIREFSSNENLRIETDFNPCLDRIHTDGPKLEQILFQLVENAVKFTESGNIHISIETEGDQLRCSIKDSGIGIAADDRSRIFDEFFKVDNERITQYAGSGLGLTVVRELLALMDGEIEVSSEVGDGSTFIFRIPLELKDNS